MSQPLCADRLTWRQLPKIAETLQGVNASDAKTTAIIEEKYITPLRVSPSHGWSAGFLTLHQEQGNLLENYTKMVEETVDLDALQGHNYVLRPTLDNQLGEIKDRLIDIRNQLDDEHYRVGKDLGVDTEKKLHLENHQVYRYSFRITKAVSVIATCFAPFAHVEQEAGLLRSRKGYIDLATQKSGSIFTTSTLKGLSDQYYDLQEEYNKAQRVLVKEVVNIACTCQVQQIRPARLICQLPTRPSWRSWTTSSRRSMCASVSRTFLRTHRSPT